MTGFSQPERRGLERQQRGYSAQAHPDADLLTAFAEQTATDREREQVLSHVAVCPACREVISLVVTPTEGAEVAQVVAKKSPVWEWPLLRWGTLAASLAVVVIAVYVGNVDKRAAVSPMTSETAPLSQQPATAREQRDSAVQTPASPGVKAPQIRYEKVVPKPSETPAKKKPSNVVQQNSDTPVGYKAEAAPRLDQRLAFENKLKDFKEAQNISAGAIGGIGNTGAASRDKVSILGKKTDSLGSLQSKAKQNEEADAMAKPAVAPAPPPPPPLVARTTAAPTAAETVTVTGQAVATEAATVGSEHASALAEMTTQKSMAAVGGARKDENRALPASRAMLSNNYNTQWLVTPEGYLLNSNDSGKNWARQLPDQRFTHVQTVANHVWASGPDGALMHSADGGVNWTRVIPSDKNNKMTGDITSIIFLDANHGTLKTSTNETWSTPDGGKTWKKQ